MLADINCVNIFVRRARIFYFVGQTPKKKQLTDAWPDCFCQPDCQKMRLLLLFLLLLILFGAGPGGHCSLAETDTDETKTIPSIAAAAAALSRPVPQGLILLSKIKTVKIFAQQSIPISMYYHGWDLVSILNCKNSRAFFFWGFAILLYNFENRFGPSLVCVG